MNTLYTELAQTPLWGRILVAVAVVIVGNFWLKHLSKGLFDRIANIEGSYWRLFRRMLVAALIAYLTVCFWIGVDKAGYPLSWGLYGRGAFILLTGYLTSYLNRHMSAK